MSEWQGIETAPNLYPFVVGKWENSAYDHDLHWVQTVVRGSKWANHFHGATHWREYPPPPAA